MKKTAITLFLGIIASSIIMGLMFYFFLFLNPLNIHEVNSLKWIPVLIAVTGIFISGKINKETPVKYLPFLLIPFIIFKLFNFAYFPFILILIAVGAITLFLTRNHKKPGYKTIGWVGVTGVFVFFLISQPLILEKEDFGYDKNGEIINASIIWSISEERVDLPDHVLFDKNDDAFNIGKIVGQKYLITFWATWCAPCLKEKPELDKLKKEFANKSSLKFIDVSFDNDRNKWENFLNNKQPLGKQLISENQQSTSREFNFNGIPMHILVSEDGTYKKYRSLEAVKNVIKRDSK
ncbi:TlpA family protein disulfide reductase [Mangrovivirga cuniculi]|uniref:Thioredoxin domain-containing protein n=1 Tax=Mangrovivirga cuniculi TaxID=2715131 RepID=A0A4D7K5S0_9BACT|nr:TlpA disulfide reductase family protein [Mangrovivirga cuniculi]QCK16154.1 hypothetical protein DCC35_16100 [Mangrovivirga cuniculi]